MKKLFGGINLTWKKLIIFAIVSGIYTAIMAMIPITKDTSFRDIAIQFEWWILFGIIIICNSKSPKDSALKCFVFFLISQPLIYLIQVPFSPLGWKIFMYYKYWFIWTLFTIPMGFIGYYMQKKNILSFLIILPMLIFLAYLGIGYLSSCFENFPNHLLSFICCFIFIIMIVLNIFNKKIFKILSLGIITLFIILLILLNDGLVNNKYETVLSLNEYNFHGNIYISFFSGTEKGNVDLIPYDNSYNVKVNGRKGGKYNFTISDEENNEYSFEYHYDKELKTIVLNEIE